MWSDPVKPARLFFCRFQGQGQLHPGQIERRLISLIFAGRSRMVMIVGSCL